MTPRRSLLALAALSIGLAPFLASAALAPAPVQDPAVQAAATGFRQEVVWNFAVLQYVNSRGELVEVPANRLTKIWLLRTAEDDMRLELLYQNNDYSSIEIDEFHVFRTAPNLSAADVPVVRDRFDAMAFPAFR